MKLALIVGKQNGDKVVAPRLRGVKDNLNIDCFDNIPGFIDMVIKRHETYDRILVLSTLVTQQALVDLHTFWGASAHGTSVVLMGKKGKDEALVDWFQKLFYSPSAVGMLVGGTTIQILAEAVLLSPVQLAEKYGTSDRFQVEVEQVMVTTEPPVQPNPPVAKPVKPPKQSKQKSGKKSLFNSLFGNKKEKGSKADEAAAAVPGEDSGDGMGMLEDGVYGDDSGYAEPTGNPFGDLGGSGYGDEDQGVPGVGVVTPESVDNSVDSFVDNPVDNVENPADVVNMGYPDNAGVNSASDVGMVDDGFEDYVPPANDFSPDEVDDSAFGSMVVEEDYSDSNMGQPTSAEIVDDVDVASVDVLKGEEAYRKATEQKPKVVTHTEVREVVRNINPGGVYNVLKNVYSGKSKKTLIVTGDRGSGITSTALNLAKAFSKKVPVLYFDCDVDNHGLLSYLDYDMFRNFENTQLAGVKLCKTSRAFDSCVMSYDDNFDILTTDYSCDATDNEIIVTQGVVAERAMDYGVVIVDCPVSRLHCVNDLILTGNTVVCVEGSRRGFMNMLCRLEASTLPLRYKRNIVSRGSLFVTKMNKQTDIRKLEKYISSVFESDGVNWLEMKSYEFNGKLSDKLMNDILEG